MTKRNLICKKCKYKFRSYKQLQSETSIQDEQAQCKECGSRNCKENKK